MKPRKKLSESEHSRYLEKTLKIHISSVLMNVDNETDWFETLFYTYPSRLRVIKNANGGHNDY